MQMKPLLDVRPIQTAHEKHKPESIVEREKKKSAWEGECQGS